MKNSAEMSRWTAVLGSLVTLAAFVATLVFMVYRLGPLGFLLDAIIVGGIGGGFTLALIGGESYGLKMPGRAGGSAQKLDPGFLGDVFVGLMAGCLGIGFGIWSKVFTGLFDLKRAPFVELVFCDFAIAYTCGFLGLRLVKTVSAQVLRRAELEQKIEANEADNTYMKAEALVESGQFEEALAFYRKTATLDERGSTRSLIGMARAYRRLKRFGDALACLDHALEMKDREPEKHRIPVAYWNRACYRAIATPDPATQIERIVEDLREAVKLQSSFSHDLTEDEDLTVVRTNPKFRELLKEFPTMTSEKKTI